MAANLTDFASFAAFPFLFPAFAPPRPPSAFVESRVVHLSTTSSSSSCLSAPFVGRRGQRCHASESRRLRTDDAKKLEHLTCLVADGEREERAVFGVDPVVAVVALRADREDFAGSVIDVWSGSVVQEGESPRGLTRSSSCRRVWPPPPKHASSTCARTARSIRYSGGCGRGCSKARSGQLPSRGSGRCTGRRRRGS